MDIGDYLKEGSEVIDGSLGDSVAARQNCIKLDRQYYKTVSEDRELRLALEKRFKGKTTLYATPNYETLVWLCLSTDGYKISSANLNSVSDDNILEVWQFLDTFSTSSTRRCRDMVSLGKNSRNAVGFSRSSSVATRQQARTRGPKSRMVLLGTPVLALCSEHCSAEHYTIEEAMLEDSMNWISKADDPVKLAVMLRSNILSDSKSI